VDNEIKKIKKRGVQAERELVKKLWRMGFAVIRGPASGSRIKKAIYPDIVAIKNSKVFVLEVKKRKELRSCYLDSNQLLKIAEFAKRAGGEALVAIKIDSLRVWKVLEVSKIVPQGTIPKRIKVDKEVIDKAEELFTYLSRKLSIGLEKFIQFQE
jgi:Holliday junction resolvase